MIVAFFLGIGLTALFLPMLLNLIVNAFSGNVVSIFVLSLLVIVGWSFTTGLYR